MKLWTPKPRIATLLGVGAVLVLTATVAKRRQDNRRFEEARVRHALRQASLPCSDHMYTTYGLCDYPASCDSRDDVTAMLMLVFEERGRAAFVCPVSGEPYRFHPDPYRWSRSARNGPLIVCPSTHGDARQAGVVTVWGSGGTEYVNIDVNNLPDHEWIESAVTVVDVETALASPATRR